MENDEESWSSHQISYSIVPFVQTGAIKPTQEKEENEFIWVKIVVILNFCKEKVTYIVFMVSGKLPPRKFPPIKLPLENSHPENTQPENSHLEYSHPSF